MSAADGLPDEKTAAAPPDAPSRAKESLVLLTSVRREIWEHRSIYAAPIAVASVILFGFVLSTVRLPHQMRGIGALEPAKQRAAVILPYDVAAALILGTAFLTGVFYCLDALYAERRDRSLLFWKSVPVSDLTAVLAKALIPLVVLPLVTFFVVLMTQVAMLLWSTVVLVASGVGPAAVWSHLPLVRMSVGLLYCLGAIALWHAPLYAWLLLVSGRVRHAAILWAVLPFLAVGVAEKVAFNSTHVAAFVRYRLLGWLGRALLTPAEGAVSSDPLSQLAPLRFLTTWGLWIGLGAAALLLVAAARQRRYREPL
jgi:ABC-2 type transport system permease protein